MNLKKSLANALKTTKETVVSKNTASFLCFGLEEMPESLKKTR